MRRTVFAIGLLIATAAFAVTTFTGRVVGITDGDTIDVMHEGRAERIRLNGIDCPEGGQAFGTRAKQFASGLASGQTVTIIVRDRDRYGRTVGDVILPDGKSLNQELVRAGMAWHYTQYSRDTTLARLEREARATRRGLWTDTNPVPPWDWRNGGRATSGGRAVESTPASTGDETVYVTRTGRKYHRDGCSYLRSGKSPMSLQDAVSSGHGPCSRCSPPRLQEQAQPRQERTPAAQAVTVYVTRTGGKYHSAGCSYLRSSSSPMSLEDAKASGYGPCSRCSPPR